MAKPQKMHFEISERKILLRLVDSISVLLMLYAVDSWFEFNYIEISLSKLGWVFVLVIYLMIFGSIFEIYNLQVAGNRLQTIRSVILTSSMTALFYFLTPILTPVLPDNRLQIIYFFFSIFVALLLWRLFYITFLASNRFIKQVVFIDDSATIDASIRDLKGGNVVFQIKGFLPLDNSSAKTEIKKIKVDELQHLVEECRISEIIVNSDRGDKISFEVYTILMQLLEKGVVVQKYSDVYEALNNRLPLHFDDAELYRFFPYSRNNQNKLYLLYSRLVDIISSIIGLLFLIGLIPFFMVFNLFWNRGPLFYKQIRVGKNGKNINIVKLRTMVEDAEKEGAVFATIKDARITPFGRFLRRTRLDELPQFYNVLKGDMALIGPRPERPVFVEEIAEKIHLYKTRHIIKPGLTGWAQVNYPYGENLEDSLMKLRYDLYYIKHRSIFLDFNIVLKTLSTVLFFRGQ